MPKSCRVVLADDFIPFRNELKKFLVEEVGLDVIGEASDGLELLHLLDKLTPHLVILDLSMPRLTGMEAMRQIHAAYPEVKVLILTMHKDDQLCRQAISAGAKGFLPKDDLKELIPAIETVSGGGVYLPRFIPPPSV